MPSPSSFRIPVRVATGAAALAAAIAGIAAVAAGRRYGARTAEVRDTLPGDELLTDASLVTTRAITIGAPPEQVWPWLVQMGYHRGGWYSIDALERAIGAGDFLTGGSADRVVPELQDLQVGDRVPLNDRAHLVVAQLVRPEALVLALPDGPFAWIWSFTLRTVSDEEGALATRLIIRTRAAARRPWLRPLLALLDAGHLVMEVVQLHRLRDRVEQARG